MFGRLPFSILNNHLLGEVKMNLTIHRATWLFGKGHAQTLLLKDGKKDVLGFLAAACGATDEQLEGKVMLMLDRLQSTLTDLDAAGFLKLLPRITDDILFDLARLNDKPGLTNESREWLIQEGFGSIGVKVTFIGEYPKAMEGD
jgi:hypothetical protein